MLHFSKFIDREKIFCYHKIKKKATERGAFQKMKKNRWIAGLLLVLLTLSACKAPDRAGAGDMEISFEESDLPAEENNESAFLEEPQPQEGEEDAEKPSEEHASEKVEDDGLVQVRVYRGYQDHYIEVETGSEELYNAVRLQAKNAASLESSVGRALPILQFDSVEAMDTFKEEFLKGSEEFAAATAGYDGEFFKTQNLFAIYMRIPKDCGEFGVHYISNQDTLFAVHIGIMDAKTLVKEGEEKEAFVLLEIAKEAVKEKKIYCEREDHVFSLVEWPWIYELGVCRITKVEGDLITVIDEGDQTQTEYVFKAIESFDLKPEDRVRLVHTGLDGSGDMPDGYSLAIKSAEEELN